MRFKSDDSPFMKIVSLLVLVFFLGGFTSCTALRKLGSGGEEQMLSAAGFQIKVADTEAKRQSLAGEVPYKLQIHTRGERVIYTYANPAKNILYVGGPKEYQAYQKMAVEQNIAAQYQSAAAQQQMTADEWGYWAPGTFGVDPVRAW